MRQIQGKFSFSKKIPQTVEELEEIVDKRYELEQQKQRKDQISDEGLLEEDEEYVSLYNNQDPDKEDALGLDELSDSDLENTIKQFDEIMKQQNNDENFTSSEEDEEIEYENQKDEFKMKQEQKMQGKSNKFLEDQFKQMGLGKAQTRIEMEARGYDYSKIEDVLNEELTPEEESQYTKEFEVLHSKVVKRFNQKKQSAKTYDNIKKSRTGQINPNDSD